MTQVCVLPGDGIGPEVIRETVRLVDSMALGIDWVYGDIGFGAYERTGSPLPEESVELVDASAATLLGAVTTPPGIRGYRSPVLQLRKRFDLYANIRPCKSTPHAECRGGVDLVVVRENTEGLYTGEESVEDDGDTAIAIRRITRRASERIVEYACKLASRRSLQKKVTLVHKANVLRETCGLFRTSGLRIAGRYPDLQVDEMLVDACAMELIRRPERFDIIVTTNLFGDILSDEASMLVGGLGLASSANIGDNHAIFEPVHGSAPDIAGKGIANPIAAFLSAALMLDHLGHRTAAERLQHAIAAVLAENSTTPDLGGTLSTPEVTAAVQEKLSGLD